jgi:hypothetical protein
MTATETMTTGAAGYPNGVAAPREFPAMPNFEKEHKDAVIRFLNGGRTTAELEALMCSRAVFDPEDVRAIRERYAAGESQRSIARDYGVNNTSIWRICHRETYKAVA